MHEFDRRTDTILVTSPRLHSIQRGKNACRLPVDVGLCVNITPQTGHGDYAILQSVSRSLYRNHGGR